MALDEEARENTYMLQWNYPSFIAKMSDVKSHSSTIVRFAHAYVEWTVFQTSKQTKDETEKSNYTRL
jgi:hypothetical protein